MRALRCTALAVVLAGCNVAPPRNATDYRLVIAGPRMASVRAVVEMELRAIVVGRGRPTIAGDQIPLREPALLSSTNCSLRVTANGDRATLHVEPQQPGPCLFAVSAQVDGQFVRTDASVDFLDADPLILSADLPPGCDGDPYEARLATWVELGTTTFCSDLDEQTQVMRGNGKEIIPEQLLGQLDETHVVTCSSDTCHARGADGESVAEVSVVAENQGVFIERGTPNRILALGAEGNRLRVESYAFEHERFEQDRSLVVPTVPWPLSVLWRDRVISCVNGCNAPLQVRDLRQGDVLFEAAFDHVMRLSGQQLVVDRVTDGAVHLVASESELRTGGGIPLGKWDASAAGVDLVADVVTHEDDGLTPWYVRLWDTSKPMQTLVAIGSLSTAFEPKAHPRGVFVILDGKRVFLERVRTP